jgi:hypothetical protein
VPIARLAAGMPAAEKTPSRLWVPLAPCDATASGSEDAQVRLVRGLSELALCAHHYGELELILAAAGWRVTHDNRGLL